MDLRESRQPAARPAATAPIASTHNRRGGNNKILIIPIILLVLLVLAGIGHKITFKSSLANVNKNGYQAVFLSNNQVYFGKLTTNGERSGSYKITDVFYLQVQNDPQAADAKTNKATNSQTNVSLAKLGTEIHSPEDTMYIEKNQVLFWENIKNDGKVVKAIQAFKSK